MTQTPQPERDPTLPLRPRWPFPLKIIFWGLCLQTVLGWIRVFQSFAQSQLIQEMLSVNDQWYLISSGVIWGTAGLPTLWGILRHRPWTITAVWISSGLSWGIYWVERIFLWGHNTTRENWPFMLALTLGWTIIILWTFSLKKTRSILHINHEPQNTKKDQRQP